MHLPYEAKVGGSVQYRWMYHIERAMKKVKPMVGNKARVEGCTAEEFKFKEIAYFSSVYFAEEHNANASMVRYHVDQNDPSSDLTIFQWKGTTVSAGKIHYLTHEE